MHSVPASLPREMRPMAWPSANRSEDTAKRLMELDWDICRSTAPVRRCPPASGSVCSWRVRCAIAPRACCMCWTSRRSACIRRMDGLLGVMRDLVADGNSVVVVDHDTRVLASVDHLVEMGPMAGAEGGRVSPSSVADVVTAPGPGLLLLRDGGKIHERCGRLLIWMRCSPRDGFIWRRIPCIRCIRYR